MFIKLFLGLTGCVAVSTVMGLLIVAGHPVLSVLFMVAGYRVVYNVVRVRD